MMTFLRSQSQAVLVVVLGVIALGFLFYGNSGNLLTSTGGHVSSDYGRIDGEDLSVAQLMDAVRSTRNSYKIHGQEQALEQPDAGRQVAQRAWAQLLLLHEADKLHVTVSDQQVLDYYESLPVFQKDGVYSPDVYESRMKQLAGVLRLPADSGVDAVTNAKTTFENIVRDDMRAEAASQALFSTVRTPAHSVASQFEKFYGASTVSVVTFDPKMYLAAAQVTPDQIQAEYKAHTDNPAYRTKEKRKIDYVVLPLTPEQMKLPDAQKATAKDALGQKALDFALAFQPDPAATGSTTTTTAVPDFYAEAKKRGLTPMTSDFFDAETPPANLPPSPAFTNGAFDLTKDNPISKVIEMDNGVAVEHLVEIQPSNLRPLNEVTPDITRQLQQTNAQAAAQAAATKAAQDLKAAVASGTDFKAAAATLGLKVDTLPAFVPMNASRNDPRLQAIAYASTALDIGKVSDPLPSEADNSSMVIHLDARAPADAAGLPDFEKRYRESQDGQLQSRVFVDWSNWKSSQPGNHKPPDLDAYGSAE